MTVSISPKHDVSQSDYNDNETCYLREECEQTGGLLLNNVAKRSMVNSMKEQEHVKELISTKEVCCKKRKKLICDYADAPEWLKHNIFILTGYRTILNTHECMESVFWWTNETINIWSHIFGFTLFFFATIRDFAQLEIYACFTDKLIVGLVLLCFQICMLSSALYHTFLCRSARDCELFLAYDLFGISLSLLAIYVSGIYFAFWCDPEMCKFYVSTIVVIFAFAMSLHIPSLKVNSHVKMLVFLAWAAYGVVPTAHWAIINGWFASPIVRLLLPKVGIMYLISGAAFFVYITKIPERFYAGRFDYLGHSHQWWHMLVLAALYYWHNGGMDYLDYRYNHGCTNHLTII